MTIINHLEREIGQWWDAAASYYQKEISGDDLNTVHYGPFGSSETKLNLLGAVKGKKVLELGCGGGQCSVTLAKKGAICTGIDISEKQLEHAVKLAEKNSVRINFIKKSFSELDAFPKNSYDIVISVFALQYAERLDRIFRSIKRILKQNGIFVFSIDHPFYLLVNPNDMVLSESYNKVGMVSEKEIWPDGSNHNFFMYRRKVSDIVNGIIQSGLALQKVIEPFDRNDKVWGSGYRRKLVHRITPTIIFKCAKT
ncbi:MAG: class I SAM-dependent methyltransferase [Candidatus Parvarchaeota archaeon]|nr:class I SAM-dependent methyltransferase [Candidatus Parvarchaeota archaeon]MCL5101141.1 class I SAM-dependent methyltransferase [Candidatus Parvarchaeota archaeon]